MRTESGPATRALDAVRRGDAGAGEELFRIVHGELKRIAESAMRRQPAGHTLQPTALVNEAYLKLLGDAGGDWNDRSHFLAASARAMRSILIDHARAKSAAKRGGGAARITFDEGRHGTMQTADEIIAVGEALSRLEEIHPRRARLVELRFFGGLTNEEAAKLMDISVRTAKRIWTLARTWLYREIRG